MKKQKEKVVRFEMKLSYDEDDKLKSDSQKANLTKSEYVRRLIMNCRLKEKPDDRFYDIWDKYPIKSKWINYSIISSDYKNETKYNSSFILRFYVAFNIYYQNRK